MQNMDLPPKKIRKNTLIKRIFRYMSLSNIITIVILSAAILSVSFLLLQGIMSSMSYFISHNIKNEMDSAEFLKQMKIDSLTDYSAENSKYTRWARKLDEMQSVDISTFDTLKNEISEEGLNVSRLYFAAVSIEIAGNIIYETDTNFETLLELQGQVGQQPIKKEQWLARVVENTKVELPITNQNEEEIGKITTNLEPNLLFYLFTLLIVIIIAMSLFALLVSKVLMRFFSIPLLNPLRDLQEKLDELAKQDVSEGFVKPIVFKKPLFEIWKLADATNKIISKMKDYTDLLELHKDELEQQKDELEITTQKLTHTNNDLERKNNQLENILNNVNQGFLTFGFDLKVKEEYSLVCKKIFQKNIEYHYFPELICPDEVEEIKFLYEIFKKIIVENDHVKAQIYIPLLPDELKINGRHIRLHYKLVKDSDNKEKNAIMVILSDITEKKVLEKQMDEERRRLKMVVKVISNQETFLEIVDDFKDFYQYKLYDLTSTEIDFETSYSEIYRQIHTFKGNFSQFDINDLVNKLHEIETNLSSNKKTLIHHGNHSIREILIEENLAQLLDKDIAMLKYYLGHHFFSQKNMLSIDKNRVSEIEDKIIQLLPNSESKQLLPIVRRLRYKSIKELLKSYTDYILKISERQEKLVKPLEITGEDVYVDEEQYQGFIKSFVHIFRNCVDHGIEVPEDRVMAGKNEMGTITCHLEDATEFMKITISDDGKGIDKDKVKESLTAKQLLSSSDLENFSESQLINAIFEDTFTTKNYANEVSGRGVGLSVVRNELEKLGGTVDVTTSLNEGTSFVFVIPHHEQKEVMPVSMKTIVEAIKSSAIAFVFDQSAIKLTSDPKSYEVKEKITLSPITAMINIRGSFNAIFALGINEELASKVVKSFVMGELSSEEEILVIEDALSEISNIILGNSVKAFENMNYVVNFGVPTILCHKGGSIKNSGASIVTAKLKKDQYEMSVSLISMDNVLEEL